MKNFTLNHTATHIIIVTLAATLAYLTAGVTSFINPTIAALIAVISVKQTLHETLQETTYQIVGTILGVGLSLTISAYLDFQWWEIPIFIILSFTIATVLKIGIRGGTVIAITIIFITAPFIDETITSQQRFFGVLLGIMFAAIVSLIPLRKPPHVELEQKIIETETIIDNVLNQMADSLTNKTLNQKQTTSWVIEVETERNKVRQYNQTYTMLEKTKHWSPTLTKTKLDTIKTRLEQLTTKTLTAKNITETLNKAGNIEHQPETMLMKIGSILRKTLTNNDIDSENREETISKNTFNSLDNTGAILLTTSLYNDVEKLKNIKNRDKKR